MTGEYQTERYCLRCHKDTIQICRDSTHERDCSDDYQECLECHWYKTGYSSDWQPPDRFTNTPSASGIQENNMKNLILLACLLCGCEASVKWETKCHPTKISKVSTYSVSLCTKDNKALVDTVSAEDESAARRIIYARYPNCIIYSVTKL